MPLPSVPAVYDGQEIKLLEPSPIQGRYRVLVTFIEPISDKDARPEKPSRFWRSLGAWQDDRPVEATLQDILKARRSTAEPPAL
ncbi:MAG: hypothetical protein JW934_04420 [Anaerolineae bacterium]|nr:hypothetical protein [Anaerolineae bacterium]